MKNNVYLNNYKLFVNTFKNYNSIWEHLDFLVNERKKHSIIETSIIVPYDDEGFVIFDLVSYSENLFIYTFSTTAK